jgi:hypothetical protein
MEDQMTKDEVLSMARQASINNWWDNRGSWRSFIDCLQAFAALAAEKEREECARVFEGREGWIPSETAAAAIRARGEAK